MVNIRVYNQRVPCSSCRFAGLSPPSAITLLNSPFVFNFIFLYNVSLEPIALRSAAWPGVVYVEIHQLEYFLAVEKFQSFSAAALEICVSQSTLSQQIRKLEDTLGVKLFIRGPRQVRLTPAGEEFIIYARRITSEIQRAKEAMHEYTSFTKGHLRIGAIPTIGYMGFNKLITAFIKEYPGIALEIQEANTDDLLSRLYNKEIHVAFITAPYVADFDIDFYPLTSDEIVVLVPATHKLALSPVIDLWELSQEKFLMIRSSTGFRNTLIRACNECGFEPDIVLESSHVEMLKGFVEEGLGVAFMGHRVASCIATESTVIVRIRPPIQRQNGLAICSSVPLSTRLFRDFVLNNANYYS
jgi:LysR family transcriptional activator of glutamate synthase operon